MLLSFKMDNTATVLLVVRITSAGCLRTDLASCIYSWPYFDDVAFIEDSMKSKLIRGTYFSLQMNVLLWQKTEKYEMDPRIVCVIFSKTLQSLVTEGIFSIFGSEEAIKL